MCHDVTTRDQMWTSLTPDVLIDMCIYIDYNQ